MSGRQQRVDRVVKRRVRARSAQPQPRQLTTTPADQISKKTYLDSGEAAFFVCRPSVEAFWMWVRANGVPVIRDGRRRLYRRKDLESVLEKKAQRALPHGGSL